MEISYSRGVFCSCQYTVEGYHSHRGKTFISKREISRGETGEMDYWLLVLFEIAEIDNDTHQHIAQGYTQILVMLNSLIQKSA